MANNGDFFEALTDSFPGKNPRPLFSLVYGTSAIVGVLTGAFWVWGAFLAGTGLGFIMLMSVLIGLVVWLGALRIMLEAAGAIFDIRETLARPHREHAVASPAQHPSGSTQLASWLHPSASPSTTVFGSPSESRTPSAAPDLALNPTAVARYLQDQDGATFDVLAAAFRTEPREVSNTIRHLEAESLVDRLKGGIYVYVGAQLGASDSSTEEITDAANE